MLAVYLACFCCAVLAQTTSTQLLSELADQGLADTLNSYGPVLIVPTGNELYVGNSISAKISSFDLAPDGSLTFGGTTFLNNLGASLVSARAIESNATGSVLYVAGDHRIAVITRATVNGDLAVASTLVVDDALEISDMSLSNDGQHLYVISNNFSFDVGQGSSSLHSYAVSSTTGALSLTATRTEPSSPTPLTSISIPSASDLVFLGRHSTLEVSRRTATSGALSLLHTHNGVSKVTPTAAGDWVFEARFPGLSAYRVDTQTGTLTLTQQLNSELPPLPPFTLRGATEVALNSSEDRLVVTGYQFAGALPTGLRILASSDVLARDLADGSLRYDGIGLRPGSTLVRHPTRDWFYTFAPSFSVPNGPLPSTPILAQQSLLPIPVKTSIVAAVLPSSRSEGDRETRNSAVTAFATVLNTGDTDALSCRAGLLRESVRNLTFRVTTTDPITNTPMSFGQGFFDVPAGGATQLIFEIHATSDTDAEPITRVPELLDVRFFCRNADMTERVIGVTTFAFASDTQQLPDLLTATASPDRPGVVSLAAPNGQSFFTVATINLGSSALISASVAIELAGSINGAEPVINPPAIQMKICETDPSTSLCKAPFADQVERTIDANEIVTYTVTVEGEGEPIAFRPEKNRAFVLLKDVDGHLRGGSSVAVETQ